MRRELINCSAAMCAAERCRSHSARCICAIIVALCVCCVGPLAVPRPVFDMTFCSKKAFITLCSPVVPLLSTSKADSGLASEFRRDRAIYTAYERMLKANPKTHTYTYNAIFAQGGDRKHRGQQRTERSKQMHTHTHKTGNTLAEAVDTHAQAAVCPIELIN